MTRYALIDDGVVVSIEDYPAHLVIGRDIVHPDIASRMHPCGPDVADGWVYDGTTFAPPVDPPVDLIAYAADKRWRVETGGIVVGGMPVATDDRSKTLIIGARIKADANPTHTLRFKAGGVFVTLDAAAIIAVSDAVHDHTQACFDAEDAVTEAVAGGLITTTQQIDDWPWPGSAG